MAVNLGHHVPQHLGAHDLRREGEQGRSEDVPHGRVSQGLASVQVCGPSITASKNHPLGGTRQSLMITPRPNTVSWMVWSWRQDLSQTCGLPSNSVMVAPRTRT